MELAEWSTRLVDYSNAKFYWSAEGHPYKFCNKHLAKWYENENNCWVDFHAQQFNFIKKVLKDKTVNEDFDYNLDFLKKIRNDYDNVNLLYSGGSDSLTVFNKCLKNQIFLDEIISVVFEDINLSCNKEISEIALPYVKDHHGKYGKHTILPVTWERMYEQYKDPYGFFTLTTASTGPPDIRRLLLPVKDRSYNSSDCYIRCTDKPQLVYYKNQWYMTINDGALGGEIAIPNQIFFWLEADNIKSHIKDARKYRNYLIKHNNLGNHTKFFKPNPKDYFTSLIRDIPENKNHLYDKNMSSNIKIADKKIESFKNTIEANQYKLLIAYYKCVEKFFEIFPETSTEKGLYEYNNNDKFAWFINIDTLDVYTQRELIPDGFQ